MRLDLSLSLSRTPSPTRRLSLSLSLTLSLSLGLTLRLRLRLRLILSLSLSLSLSLTLSAGADAIAWLWPDGSARQPACDAAGKPLAACAPADGALSRPAEGGGGGAAGEAAAGGAPASMHDGRPQRHAPKPDAEHKQPGFHPPNLRPETEDERSRELRQRLVRTVQVSAVAAASAPRPQP